jgi:hypothetical protein
MDTLNAGAIGRDYFGVTATPTGYLQLIAGRSRANPDKASVSDPHLL